jgi:hypothetical protein
MSNELMKIGDTIECLDMFMQNYHESVVYGFCVLDDEHHVILSRDGRYSLGQICFRTEKEKLTYYIRSTSWHASLDALKEYWKTETGLI